MMMNPAQGITLGKVLVVDDNPIIQRTVYFALRDRGFTVVMTGEIFAALKIIREQQFGAILLDLNFPFDASISGGTVCDGFWALNWMRRMEETKGVPIIIVSSDPPEKSMSRAMSEGAAAYFQKPLNMSELAATLARLIPPIPPIASAPAAGVG